MARESLDERRARMKRVIRALKREYPHSGCSLRFDNPFQLLVATVLSAQCTDERVNRVTPGLFARYPGPRELAHAPLAEIEECIRSTGFYKNKALALQTLSRCLVERHHGEVPADLDALTELRGVGRKTANVVLGTAFGIPSGVVVDTHVGRIARRMGFTRSKDPVKVESELAEVIERKDWVVFSHLLIDHGRKICSARRHPDCENCVVASDCRQVLSKV